MSDSHTCKRASYLLPNGSRVTVESTHPRGRIRVTTEKPAAPQDAPPPLCGNCVFWSRHADASRFGDCSNDSQAFTLTGERFGCAHFRSYPVA